MTRFNRLYHGPACEAADELDCGTTPGNEELGAALVNALRRIDLLERTLVALHYKQEGGMNGEAQLP